jgi:ketosteroid isomerase-like protein
MAQSNVEVVRRFYEAWARDEFPGPVELMDPDIEYANPTGAVEPGTRRGLPAFKRAVEKMLESWEFWRAEPEELKPIGSQVAVVVRYRTRGRGSGIEVAGRESALWTLRDGKVVRYQWFHGPSDALDAAGLGERPRATEHPD